MYIQAFSAISHSMTVLPLWQYIDDGYMYTYILLLGSWLLDLTDCLVFLTTGSLVWRSQASLDSWRIAATWYTRENLLAFVPSWEHKILQANAVVGQIYIHNWGSLLSFMPPILCLGSQHRKSKQNMHTCRSSGAQKLNCRHHHQHH